MPDENSNERDWEALERETVYLLTDPTGHPPIWLVADIGRELEDTDPDAIVNAGLLHRTSDDHVFATPAAFKMVQMVVHVV
jgi:hypothetical protein